MDSKLARIHSFETFGTVDGPGIRFIIFMQGCSLKCKYCQNRDTWVITESGLYSLVLTSNKPEAKRFKKWVPCKLVNNNAKPSNIIEVKNVMNRYLTKPNKKYK